MAAAILLPSAVIVQMVALGANGAALAVVAAMANLCVAIACQFLLRTEEEFWRRTAWATGVFALIVLWIAAPAIVMVAASSPAARKRPGVVGSGPPRDATVRSTEIARKSGAMTSETFTTVSEPSPNA